VCKKKKIKFAKNTHFFRTKSYTPKAEKVEEICWPLGGEAPMLVQVVMALPFHTNP
jgi:hypothetical protein